LGASIRCSRPPARASAARRGAAYRCPKSIHAENEALRPCGSYFATGANLDHFDNGNTQRKATAFEKAVDPGNLEGARGLLVEALETGLTALAPGRIAGDIDALVRNGLDYPHHSGHGVGVAAHEEPRIVPGGETELAPGMVVALEPGTYPGPWGMRVERVALVTEAGCEVLSKHDLSL
jgi:hypothetical protein